MCNAITFQTQRPVASRCRYCWFKNNGVLICGCRATERESQEIFNPMSINAGTSGMMIVDWNPISWKKGGVQ